jgi:hypothetical protein
VRRPDSGANSGTNDAIFACPKEVIL